MILVEFHFSCVNNPPMILQILYIKNLQSFLERADEASATARRTQEQEVT